jgi:hypothetical protein
MRVGIGVTVADLADRWLTEVVRPKRTPRTSMTMSGSSPRRSSPRSEVAARRRWRRLARGACPGRLGEVDGDMLYVYAKDEEMEDNFALHISIIATGILKREIGIVLVLPKQLSQ